VLHRPAGPLMKPSPGTPRSRSCSKVIRPVLRRLDFAHLTYAFHRVAHHHAGMTATPPPASARLVGYRSDERCREPKEGGARVMERRGGRQSLCGRTRDAGRTQGVPLASRARSRGGGYGCPDPGLAGTQRGPDRRPRPDRARQPPSPRPLPHLYGHRLAPQPEPGRSGA
jgi:hypothetical protein